MDTLTRNQVILANLGIAFAYAFRYRSPVVPVEDLKQEAVLGMIEASEKYRPERGMSFSNFATFFIRRRFQVATARERLETVRHTSLYAPVEER